MAQIVASSFRPPLPFLAQAGLCLLLHLFLAPTGSCANALETYVRRADTNHTWKLLDHRHTEGCTIAHLEMISQNWRDHRWLHHMQIVKPDKMRNPHLAFLFVTGDGEGNSSIALLQLVAERAGVMAAVVSRVPNQPLYDGRKEDALIAYTFDQYLKSGDESWPLLFPMVKSAVRAMDTVQAFAQREHQQKVEAFVVSGASKRGWTTWLTGAVDPRVKGIAPMVIDVLNMKTQALWAEKVYGKQSDKVKDYSDYNLFEKLDAPGMVKLRGWVDPYTYRQRYNMPKLILLGTNDPYWTVDSLRHYWNDLPGPKLIFQTPNAGHDLGGGKEARQTLAAFVQMIADGQALPKMEWSFKDGAKAEVSLTVNPPAKSARLWVAESTDRDFRNEHFYATDLEATAGSRKAVGEVKSPGSGYRAYLGEVVLTSPDGHEYKLSTEARVTPDNIK
ncbi:MAG TPA: PhoPQ-activated protein PqaA family protein [Verrucomicrobiae bacterium]